MAVQLGRTGRLRREYLQKGEGAVRPCFIFPKILNDAKVEGSTT